MVCNQGYEQNDYANPAWWYNQAFKFRLTVLQTGHCNL